MLVRNGVAEPIDDPGIAGTRQQFASLLAYALRMIRMETFSELEEQNHALALYCAECERWGVADLPGLIRKGYGERQVTATRFRCRDCGGVVEKQLRPPTPQVDAAAAYV